MFKYLNKGISTPVGILVIVLAAVIVGGAVLISQNEVVPKEISNQPIVGQEEKIIENAEEDTEETGEETEEVKNEEVKGIDDEIMTETKSELTQEQLDALPTISNPIKMNLGKIDAETYVIVIRIDNPFPYPINAEITHGTHFWNASIPARERKTFDYEIYPEIGVETTIPAAHMEYYDFQHSLTISFDSDSITFTP